MKVGDINPTLVKTTLLVMGSKNLTKKELDRLSPTAKGLFHFIDKFGKLHSIKSSIVIYMLNDQIQKTETDICGVFQLYIYKNLLGPQDNRAIMFHGKLTNHIVQRPRNELFWT